MKRDPLDTVECFNYYSCEQLLFIKDCLANPEGPWICAKCRVDKKLLDKARKLMKF